MFSGNTSSYDLLYRINHLNISYIAAILFYIGMTGNFRNRRSYIIGVICHLTEPYFFMYYIVYKIVYNIVYNIIIS